MNNNQKQVEKAHLKLEKEALKELKDTYQKALGDIEERVKALQSDEVLESKIRQLNYQKALETQVSGILDVLKTDNTVTINKYLTKAYENGFIGTLYNMQNEEIPLALGIDQKQVLTSISKKIENMTFADREDKNMNDFKKKIKAEITRGIANNSKYNEIARQLDLVTKEGVNSSYRITRTEMGRVSQESKYDCMLRAKANGADIVKQWDSTMDHRTRESHSKLDGQVKELEEPFEIDGMKAMYPMGFGIASMDINCRCVVLERARWAIEGELNGENTFTKAVRNKDGMTEIREFNTSSYNAFKKDFFKWQEEVKEKAIKNDKTLLNTLDDCKKLLEKIGVKYFDNGHRIDEKLMVENTQQFYELVQKFPKVQEFIDDNTFSFELYNGGRDTQAYVRFGLLRQEQMSYVLCPNSYKDYGKFVEKIKIDINSRWQMPCIEEKLGVYTATHEFGHVIHNVLIKDYFSKNPAKLEKIKERVMKSNIAYGQKIIKKEESKILKEYFDEIKDIAETENSNFRIFENLSRYGQSNYAEAFAETFANSQCGKPNELGKAMNIWLKERGLMK